MTYGQIFESALKCQTPEEGKAWLAEQVQYHVVQFNQTPEEAEKIIKANLGYFAGYYDEATREKIERIFNAEHPVFGSVSVKHSPNTLYNMGKQMAERDN